MRNIIFGVALGVLQIATASAVETGHHLGKAGSPAAPTTALFATVNDVPLSMKLYEFLLGSRLEGEGMGEEDAHFDQQMHRDQAAKDLIMTELLRQRAVEHGMHQSELFKVEMEMAEKTLLAQLFVQKLLSDINIDESLIKQHYQERPEQSILRFMIWRSRDQAEAQRILSRLQADPDATIESAVGLEPIETPWMRRTDIEPEVEQIVREIPVSGFADQPLLQDGVWKVVQVIDRKVLPRGSYEEERSIIRSELQQQELEKIYENLARNASIVFN
jgi:hypothetical protein